MAVSLGFGRRREPFFERPSLGTRDCGIWGTDLDPCAMPEGPGVWLVFRVQPQAELVTAYAMRKRSWAAWVPHETKWIASSRYDRLKKREVRRPLIPGYLLCRFASADPREWLRLLDLENVLGVLGRDGCALPVPARQVARLASEAANRRAKEFQRHMPTNRVFGLGDRVEVLTGPLAERPGEVREILLAEQVAVVEMEGVQARVKVSLSNLGYVA